MSMPAGRPDLPGSSSASGSWLSWLRPPADASNDGAEAEPVVVDEAAPVPSANKRHRTNPAPATEPEEEADDDNNAPAAAPKLVAPSSMTVAALKAELDSLGQPTDGLKKVLVARLEAARNGTASTSASNPTSTSTATERPMSVPPPAMQEGPAEEDVMMVDDEEVAVEVGGAAAAEPIKKKRMSVDAAQLSIPVLQGKIKMALGPNAKLPKKKPDLLAMYLKHCEH